MPVGQITEVSEFNTKEGKKAYQEKLFTSFRLSDRYPKKFLPQIKTTPEPELSLSVTQKFYGGSGQKDIDPCPSMIAVLVLKSIQRDLYIVLLKSCTKFWTKDLISS